ncbi:MAG: YARHG domain-containing protein [Ruminococcaceae bacterium]|nr:YARHG domain-containing protein [Oscillospiraceae bacterium]
MYCKTCGRELQPGHAFCGGCGTPAPKAPQADGVNFGNGAIPASQTPLYRSDLQYNPPAGQPVRRPDAPKPPKRGNWKLPVIIGLCAVLVILLVVATVFVVDFLRPEPMVDPGPPSISDPTPHIPVEPDEPEEPDTPAVTDGPLVTDAFYDDTHLTSYGSGVFAIPQINLDSSEIRAINDEIYQELYTNLTAGALREWDNSGKSVTYTWAENGDTLSLLIEVHPVDWEWTDYYVYNISISEARELSKLEVIDSSGITNYYKTARQALEAKFWGNYDHDWLQETTDMVDFFNEQLDATRANSNIEKALPYFNRKGELCVVADIYSLAGASYYTQEVNLEDFYYEDRFAGYAEAAVSDDDYIIPDSNTRRISESELYGLTEHECWLALNEIYARHGRLFARQEFADYFESKPWYNGYIEGSIFDANADSYLNSIEQANLATIIDYQKRMGWR